MCLVAFSEENQRRGEGLCLTCERLLSLGRELAASLRQGTEAKPMVVVGGDPRPSTDMLLSALTAGLCSAGADVQPLGTVPTPAVAFLTQKYGAQAGVMVTGSHREPAVNGIKLFDKDGFFQPVPMEWLYGPLSSLEESDLPGRVLARRSAAEDYVTHLLGAADVSLQGMRLAVDCADGAAAATAERLFTSLGAECYMMNAEPDGSRINREGGPLHTEKLADEVVRHKYFAGIALDGDADRCVLVDEKGNLLDGDKMLAALIYDRKEKDDLPGGMVAVDAASNMGLSRFCESLGVSAVTVTEPAGIPVELRRSGGALGGSPGGHILEIPYATAFDGQLTALRLLTLCRERGWKLSRAGALMERFPQVTVSIRTDEEGKARFMIDSRLQQAVREAGEQLGHEGRVRAWVADAEPLIFVSAEGRDFEEVNRLAVALAKEIGASVAPAEEPAIDGEAIPVSETQA